MKRFAFVLMLVSLSSVQMLAQTKRVRTPEPEPLLQARSTASIDQVGHNPYNPLASLSEGFESATFPPTGWVTKNVLGAAVWSRSTAQFRTGVASAFITYQTSGGEDWLVTPLQTSIALGDSVIFYVRKQFTSAFPPDSLNILVSTTDTAVASFTTNILSIDVANMAPSAWVRFSASLSAFAAQQIYVAFKHTDTDGNGMWLDDVTISAGAPPSIVYTVLGSTGSTGNRNLTATITDGSGVAGGGNAPRIYYRKGTTGAFSFANAGTVVGNDYTFTIDYAPLGGVTGGDIIQYYVAAQDIASAPNVATNPAGGSGINPPGTTPPSSPNSYSILLVVSSFPYTEDFEGASAYDNPNTGGAGWITGIISGSANDWMRATPSKTQIAGAHGGLKAFVTLATGSYNNSENSFLQSPTFDFSALGSDPTLAFWQNFRTEANWDAGVLECSTDGGSVWRRVDSTLGTGGTFNTTNSAGWYNNSSTSGPVVPPKWSGTSTAYAGHASGWIQSTTLLVGFAGKPDVRFRWRFGSDGTGVDEGWAIDDVTVSVVDAPPSIVYTALGSTGSTGNRNLTATITDGSGVAGGGNAPRIYYRKGITGPFLFANAGTVVGNDYTFTIDYAPLGGVTGGDIIQYYVAAQDIASAPNVATNPAGGSGINPPGTTPPSSSNSYSILLVVSSFPYTEDFEGASAYDNPNTGGFGWTTGIITLANNSWVRGTPAKTQIAAAHGGTKAFVTLTTGNYPVNEHSFLQAPVFDFSSLGADPRLSFWQNFKTQAGVDAGVLEYSTDGGSVWRRADSTLGTGATFNTPNSTGWYNSSSASGIITPNKWSGSSTTYTGHASGWIQSTTPLTGFAGKSDVRLRWRFYSDASTTDEGWAIDDVAIVIGGTDVVAPVVTYSTFGYSSPSNLSLNNFATITDNVGVSSGTNAPRFYYKKTTDANAFVGNTSANNGWKHVVASNSSSPYSFTVDYSIIFGGSVVPNDTVQYFVAAQDDANNLGSTPGRAGASTSPPIQNINSKPASVNSYVIKSSLSGAKNIPGDYTSLTGASGLFADINSKLLVGNMVVNITADLTEDGTNALLQWIEEGAGGFTLTIQPDGTTERLISGSVANGMIRLDGADRVTIDGRSGGSGRYLRFRNTNTSNTTISIIGDVTFSTVRNSIIEGAGPSVVSIAPAGSYLTGYRNSTQNSITECQIRDRTDVTGVPTTLISVSEFGDGVLGGSSSTISNNELFNFTGTAINVSGSIVSNPTFWTISGNTIYETSPRSTNLVGIGINHTPGPAGQIIRQNTIRNLETSATAIGISLVEDNTYIGSPLTSIARNRIYAFTSTSGSTGSLVGILIQSTYGTSPVISNNQISIVPSSANNQSIIGISCTGHHGSANLYYNSILVGGSANGASSTYAAQTATLYSPGYEMFYRISNNIFVNKRTGGTGNHGAIRKLASATILHNLYAGTGATPANFMDWGAPFTFAQWLTAWNDITSYGTEASNINTDNLFVDPLNGNLNINPANPEAWSVNGRGIAGSSSGSIADDYGATAVRSVTSGTPTDIGSDEFNINPGVEPPAALMTGTIANGVTTTFASAGRTVGSILWHGSTAPTSPMTLPTSVTFKYYPGTLPPPFITGQSNFINSYWDITVPDGSGFTYDLTLNYAAAEINAISEPNLGVAKRTGGNPWIHLQGSVANTTSKTVFMGGLTGFSQFTLDDNLSPLPIQLASFTATEIPNHGVRLRWATLSEINNYGFYVQRKRGNDSLFAEVPSSFIAGNGTTNEPHNYEFRDSIVARGSWSYRLKQVDLDGTIHFTDVIQVSVLTDVKESAPIEFALFQNYPNPFNPSTTIKFSVEKTDRATIQVYNILGQHVATLFDDVAEAGQFYKVRFDGSNLASGMYVYRLASGKQSDLKKLLLLK